MRTLIKRILFTIVSLFIISKLFPSVSFAGTPTLVMTGIVLTLLTIFVRPVLKLLFLPINLITFGLFAWLVNIIILYLAVILVPGFHIDAITISSVTIGPFIFPAYELTQFWSFVLVSFLVSLGNGVLGWL